jgi:lipopolysaccharide export system protein LptA
MTMKNWAIAAGAAVLLGLGAFGAAQAQLSAKGGPIDVTGDHFQANDAERVATYQGKVEVLQNGNRLRTDLLNIYFRKGAAAAKPASGAVSGGWGDIDHLEAIGNVYFVTSTQVVRGDKAVYTQAADTIVVTGNVVVTQGENVMHGERLVIQVGAGKTTMDSNGRVRGVFFPDKSKQGGAH